MELFVNNTPVNFEQPIPENMSSLVELIVESGNIEPDSLVSGILVDGKELEINEEGLGKTTINPDSEGKLELFFENPSTLYKNMLEDGIQFCRSASQESKQLGMLFRRVELDKACGKFANLLEEMGVFISFVQKLGDFTAEILDDNNFDDKFHPAIDNLGKMIHIANQAQNRSDWILLADLLEHESHQVFEKFIEAIDFQWEKYQLAKES